jgi:hypothetical protein
MKRPKLLTVKFRLSRPVLERLHEMMWMDSSESEDPKVRQAAKVVTHAVRKVLQKPE